MSDKYIGVVVIGRNEGQRLILCLESILKVNVPCVYVDSQSTDNSVTEAQKRGIETVLLDASSPINASRARNEGFDKLIKTFPELEYVHFIDADCELNEQWLDIACSTLQTDEQLSIVVGRLHEKQRNETVYMRLCDIDWYVKPGYAKKCGGIFTVRRQIYADLNGFDTSLIAGADPEFCHRLELVGGKIFVLDTDMGTHDSAMYHFSQWWKRAVKVGFGYANGVNWAKGKIKSILFWAVFLPILIGVLAFSFSSWYISGILLYLIQIVRIYTSGVKTGTNSIYDRWLYSAFCVLAKFPQAIGAFRFYINKVRGRNQRIIEYKA